MQEAIKRLLLKHGKIIKNRSDLETIKRSVCKKEGLKTILNADILQEYRNLLNLKKISQNETLEKILRKRSVRTMSGIAPVAVLTESYPCPGHCAYCPHEKDVPVSYLSNEPAVMRAIRCHYDPYIQTISRLKALVNNGHQPTKIELIVIGGTWSYLPKNYRYFYILNCFKAANDFSKYAFSSKKINSKEAYPKKLSLKKLKEFLAKEQKRNEKSKYKIIGLTLETRPDYINLNEVREMRELGCTRVEIGVQAVDDDILKLNKRGHGVLEIALATKLLKQFGFKVTYHLMPALPGATPEKDLELFKKLFTDERFQPDQIKFYPTVVTKGSLLYTWYKKGKYQPYSDAVLQKLIVDCKSFVPTYVRIIRLIRDIPSESIIAGNKITNLRQVMQQNGVKCNCIRCREAKDRAVKKYRINILKYKSSGGIEYFISADSYDKETLFGFCRLRIDKNSEISPAIIRELHVYGELATIGSKEKVQHRGLGIKMLALAEDLTRQEGLKKIAVISGVGVRNYYRKNGYRLKNTYLEKKI